MLIAHLLSKGFQAAAKNLNFFVCLQNEHFAHEQIKDYRIRFLNSQHAHDGSYFLFEHNK